jgi:hypothetical protein
MQAFLIKLVGLVIVDSKLPAGTRTLNRFSVPYQ